MEDLVVSGVIKSVSDEEIITVKNSAHFLHRIAGRLCRRRARSFGFAPEIFVVGAVFEYVEVAIELLIKFADTRKVVKAVAIVWS